HVYAIDPHEDYWENGETHYGMHNHAALLRNLVEFDVADIVRVISVSSVWASLGWFSPKPIHLLWIDGNHEYMNVRDDLTIWSEFLVQDGIIALHDTSGHFPGVTQALNEFLSPGQWQIAAQI